MDKITDNDRYVLLQNSMVSEGENRIGDITMRPMTLGSLLQLQRIGNPFGGLSLEGLNESDPQSLYYMAEMTWLHSEDPAEVKKSLSPDSVRRDAVENYCQKINIADLPKLTQMLVNDLSNNQAAMVTPQSDSVNDPNGHGPAGALQ